MKLGNFLKDLIIEQSRMEFLIDKYSKSTKKDKKGNYKLSMKK